MAAFDGLFQTVQVSVPPAYGNNYTLLRTMCATEAAAREALQLVQKYEPGATLRQTPWGSGRPYLGDKPIWEVELPNGERMNAGLIVAQYYRNGWGANAASEAEIAGEVARLSAQS
jgi:hypothetical protein